MRPDRFFLLAGLLSGLAFLVLTPPFQVPDEPAHFYRAYALSEGEPWAQRGGEELGAVLPASLEELGTGLLGDLPLRSGRTIQPETILRAFQVPLEEERRVFVDYRTSAQFTLVPYLPQAAGIAIARWLGASPLGLLYAARLANLLVAAALIAVGLRRLPSYSWLLTLLALTPMALFLRASASADALCTAVAFLLAGTVARLAWGEEERGGWREIAIVAGCTAALCLSKPVYIPLAGLALLIPAFRLPGRRRFPALTLVGLTASAAFVLALATANAVDLPIRPGSQVDRDRQIQDSLAEPFRVTGILTQDYLRQGDRYVAQMVGQLGWLDTNLPKPFLWGYLILLGVLALCDGRGVDVQPWQRALLGLIVLVTLALVSASQYAAWTPYGAGFIEGIQGRYFLPLAPAAAWLLHTRRFAAAPTLLSRTLPWLSLLATLTALWTVARRYYEI